MGNVVPPRPRDPDAFLGRSGNVATVGVLPSIANLGSQSATPATRSSPTARGLHPGTIDGVAQLGDGSATVEWLPGSGGVYLGTAEVAVAFSVTAGISDLQVWGELLPGTGSARGKQGPFTAAPSASSLIYLTPSARVFGNGTSGVEVVWSFTDTGADLASAVTVSVLFSASRLT